MKVTFEISDNEHSTSDMHPEDKLRTIRDMIADAFCVDVSKVNLLVIRYTEEKKEEQPIETEPQKEGKCPNCQSSRNEDLDYGIAEFTAGHMSYPYICKACGFEGIEHHRLEFECHTNKKNEEIKQEEE